MLNNGIVTHGYFVRNKDPLKQLQEVIRNFDLRKQFNPFHRCLECNGIIDKDDKKVSKVSWKGSHH